MKVTAEEYFRPAFSHMTLVAIVEMEDGYIASGLSVCRDPSKFNLEHAKRVAKARAVAYHTKMLLKRDKLCVNS